jgi:hypothetical protein
MRCRDPGESPARADRSKRPLTGFAWRWSVELSPLGISETLPVCRLVAGTDEGRSLDASLEHNWMIAVAGLPVIGQPAARRGQDARGEILAVDPRQDEDQPCGRQGAGY